MVKFISIHRFGFLNWNSWIFSVPTKIIYKFPFERIFKKWAICFALLTMSRHFFTLYNYFEFWVHKKVLNEQNYHYHWGIFADSNSEDSLNFVSCSHRVIGMRTTSNLLIWLSPSHRRQKIQNFNSEILIQRSKQN